VDREERIADLVVGLADAAADRYDAMDVVQRLADACVELLPISVAALMFVSSGTVVLPVSTARGQAGLSDPLALALHDGPARDCYRSGMSLGPLSLADAGRLWPLFGTHARRAGFTGFCVLPIRSRTEVVGSIVLLRRTSTPLPGAKIRLAQALAEAAAIGLLHERALRDHGVATTRLQGTLKSLAVIEQAKGALAARTGSSPGDAYETMRRYARYHGRHLADIAREVSATGALPRPAGRDVSRQPFAHTAVFYRGERQYLERTVRFVLDGLDAGDPVAVAVPGTKLAMLRSALGGKAGLVHWFDMTKAGRNPGWIIPGMLREFADGYFRGRVRIVGEPIWAGRTDSEYPACVQHEALINLAFTGREVSILCPYDTGALEPRVLADAAITHPVVIDDSGEHASDRYSPHRIVEGYNLPLLAPGRAAVLVLDQTTFEDVEGWVSRQAERLDVGGDVLRDVGRVVDELIDNTQEHGGGEGVLRIWAEEGQLVVEVRDAGQITDPLAGRVPREAGKPGLVLVNQLADLVRMHTGPDSSTVRAYFSRN